MWEKHFKMALRSAMNLSSHVFRPCCVLLMPLALQQLQKTNILIAISLETVQLLLEINNMDVNYFVPKVIL